MGQQMGKQRKKIQITNQDQLKFYTEVLDPNLGLVQIYTCRKYQLCYILKYQKNLEDTKIYNMYKKIESNNLNPLLSLYGYNIERKTCCNKICDENVCSYWQYYNFYFNQYLQRRRKQNLLLVDSEIWHIVEICCQTYNLFRKFGVYYQINPETFVITPYGKLKAFWCHIRSQNSHIRFFQYFDSNFKVYRFAYAPEELQYMHEQQRTAKLDFDKCNSYRLGMLLFECLSLVDPLSSCYNPSMTAICPCAVRNLIKTKIEPNYPVQIVNLVKSLLREDPKRRPSLSTIYEQNYERFNQDFELRVCGMVNNDESQNMGEDYLDFGRIRQENNVTENFNIKKGSDVSDDKTVKFRYSVRRN